MFLTGILRSYQSARQIINNPNCNHNNNVQGSIKYDSSASKNDGGLKNYWQGCEALSQLWPSCLKGTRLEMLFKMTIIFKMFTFYLESEKADIQNLNLHKNESDPGKRSRAAYSNFDIVNQSSDTVPNIINQNGLSNLRYAIYLKV